MRSLFKNSVGAFLFLMVSGCGSGGAGAISAETSRPDAPPATVPDSPPPVKIDDSRPQVIYGWLDAYSNAIEETVAGKYPELLSLAPARMAKVCPSWSALPARARERFWSSLLWSIAGPESDRDRTAILRETSLPMDPVTGKQIRSEGLLQLSYADVVAYAYTGHDISWAQDRAMALSDYAKGVSNGNPKRTILNAYANLNLGLWIMYRQLISLNPAETLEKALGRYWSTMRTTGAGFPRVLANLRSATPGCFH